MRDIGNKFLAGPVRPLQLPAHDHKMGGQLADLIAPPCIQPDIIPAFGDPLGSGGKACNRFNDMQHSNNHET
ncbi:hypothetical protein D3C76_1633260 [compost metagenome]